MRIAFFEDERAAGLIPIALMRPVFELVCGQWPLRERLIRSLRVTEWGVFVREHLAASYREAHPEARVNDFAWLAEGPTLVLNGRWLPSLQPLAALHRDEAGMIGQAVAWITLDPLEVPLVADGRWTDGLPRIARTRNVVKAGGVLIEHPWDLVEQNSRQLHADFLAREHRPVVRDFGPQVALLGPADHIAVHPSVQVDPFVVIDARKGPVTIDARAVIQSFTRIEGPCHIGHESQLFRATIRGGTTVGPVCRVGGDVEASILHSHVNKYHDGFLGHSYVCPWVNLGAQSTTSDLRNDYGPVKVPLEGEPIETRLTKVGSFLGDYARAALGSLFNTGSSIGVLAMVMPAGPLLPRHVPSFSQFWNGELAETFDLEQSVAIARAAMRRRNCELSRSQERLLRTVYELTTGEREEALRRSRERRMARQALAVP